MNIFRLIILFCGLASTVLANDQDGSAKAKQIEPDTQRGISRAVVVSDSAQLHTAQILPDGDALKTGEFLPQLESVLKNLERVLKQAETSLSQCVKLNLYATSDQDAPIQSVRRAMRMSLCRCLQGQPE